MNTYDFVIGLGAAIGIGGLAVAVVNNKKMSDKLDISMRELKNAASDRISESMVTAAVSHAAENAVKKTVPAVMDSANKIIHSEVRGEIEAHRSDILAKTRARLEEDCSTIAIDKSAVESGVKAEVTKRLADELFTQLRNGLFRGLPTMPDSNEGSSVVKDILGSTLSDFQKETLIRQFLENQYVCS